MLKTVFLSLKIVTNIDNKIQNQKINLKISLNLRANC